MQTQVTESPTSLSSPMRLDLDRCRRGMCQIDVRGIARASLIETAIYLIQANPADALKKGYLGIKNYAHFGDQREDHSYGMGPKHGTIVFRIGRRDPDAARLLDADAIYYLEAYRDFTPLKWVDPRATSEWDRNRELPLGEVISKFDLLTKELALFSAALSSAQVVSHTAPGPLSVSSEVRR